MSMLKIAVVVMTMDSERGKIGFWPCELALFVKCPHLLYAHLLFRCPVSALVSSTHRCQHTRAQGARLGNSMWGYSMGDTL